MTHTPGPWKNNCFLVSTANERDEICHTGGHLNPTGPRAKEAEANAQLIAAAPEMLEVLREIVAADDAAADELLRAFGTAGDRSLTEKARAVISKVA